MPHRPEPFYRAPRRLWYVQIDGKQINLGREENPRRDGNGDPVPCPAVVTRFHELMANRGNAAPPPPPTDQRLALAVVDQFLGWVERHKSPRTYEWYRRHCEAFARSVPGTLPVAQLKPFHLTQLCDRQGAGRIPPSTGFAGPSSGRSGGANGRACSTARRSGTSRSRRRRTVTSSSRRANTGR
jgi:hypothetical protein